MKLEEGNGNFVPAPSKLMCAPPDSHHENQQCVRVTTQNLLGGAVGIVLYI